MSLELADPQAVADSLVAFIQQVFVTQHTQKTVIAVSGGIDSALALQLLTLALGAQNVTALLLPYGAQDMTDANLAVTAAKIPNQNVITFNIQSIVEAAAATLTLTDQDAVRLGNLKARARMMCVFDSAKKIGALVCGTENKSEHYLGYFTRFGDAASDLEPISTLYKTQVRQLASYLKLPEPIISKPPSAGLWTGQTDEQEMGFTYEQADQVLTALVDEQQPVSQLAFTTISPGIGAKIVNQVQSMDFKLRVPYILESS